MVYYHVQAQRRLILSLGAGPGAAKAVYTVQVQLRPRLCTGTGTGTCCPGTSIGAAQAPVLLTRPSAAQVSVVSRPVQEQHCLLCVQVQRRPL